MRSKDITTVNHHLNTHLIKNGMATIEKKGAIKKERFIKITDKGKSALSETLKREQSITNSLEFCHFRWKNRLSALKTVSPVTKRNLIMLLYEVNGNKNYGYGKKHQ